MVIVCTHLRQGAEGRHLRFLPLLLIPLFLSLAQTETGDLFDNGERQRIFSSVSFSTCSQGQIVFCYTDRKVCAGAT